MHKALLLVSSILLVNFYLMIALKAVGLVGFWVSLLGKKSISLHYPILAGGDSLASAKPPEWHRSTGVLRLGACSVFKYWMLWNYSPWLRFS